jgi:uncharacterized cysteine cluster protein YcgN (CxxCxxCC family)
MDKSAAFAKLRTLERFDSEVRQSRCQRFGKPCLAKSRIIPNEPVKSKKAKGKQAILDNARSHLCP